jgi:hypothetical protein
LPTVIAYAQNQKEHHRQQTINEAMEKWSEEEDGVVVYLEGSIPPRDESQG